MAASLRSRFQGSPAPEAKALPAAALERSAVCAAGAGLPSKERQKGRSEISAGLSKPASSGR